MGKLNVKKQFLKHTDRLYLGLSCGNVKGFLLDSRLFCRSGRQFVSPRL